MHPKFSVAKLREIGCGEWDPIGLREIEKNWETLCPDEYDSYLLKAAGMLWNGKHDSEVVDYLSWIEADYMGRRKADLAAITKTVAALKSYVEEVRKTSRLH